MPTAFDPTAFGDQKLANRIVSPMTGQPGVRAGEQPDGGVFLN